MHIERDVAVPTRDGSPIVVDVLRPDGTGPFPVITSISPYGKDVHWPDRFPLYELVANHENMVWETPDPVWWVARGYALVRADTRGTGKSPGRLNLFGKRDAEDYYDVIEWAADQPWSNGKVATSGISWLAQMGWRVAALQPPHLAAVVAWEGATDFYRELVYQGGLYANSFLDYWWAKQIEPQRNGTDGEDWRDELPRHPFIDDYHRERTVDLDRVTVPVLSAANWGALHVHLRGNIEGWRRAASTDKWLVVHTGTHVDPYYADWAQELQLRFLDRYLKERLDSMDGVAPVRLAIRHGRETSWRDATDFPLPGTSYRELYLGEETLDWTPPDHATSITYPAVFDTAPATETLELTGPIALRLWISTDQDDLDILARIEHLGMVCRREPHPGRRTAGRTRSHDHGMAQGLPSGHRRRTIHTLPALAPPRPRDPASDRGTHSARNRDLAHQHHDRTRRTAAPRAGRRRQRPRGVGAQPPNAAPLRNRSHPAPRRTRARAPPGPRHCAAGLFERTCDLTGSFEPTPHSG